MEKVESNAFEGYFLKKVDENEQNQVWEAVKQRKKEIKEVGKKVQKKYKRGACLVVAPEDQGGEYRFIKEFEEDE